MDMRCYQQRTRMYSRLLQHLDASVSRSKDLVWEKRKNGVLRDIDASAE